MEDKNVIDKIFEKYDIGELMVVKQNIDNMIQEKLYKIAEEGGYISDESK